MVVHQDRGRKQNRPADAVVPGEIRRGRHGRIPGAADGARQQNVQAAPAPPRPLPSVCDDEADVPADQGDGREPGPLAQRHGPLGHRAGAPHLKACFGEIGARHLHFVAAELTLAGLLPHLAGLKDLATDSLTRARAQVTALAAA
ncbi:hypothetical protein [Streptomyces canus]|uniref:hypothetical protein n=1 Tax=Streptomyces canus TaxID=58343 RepID=UPI003710A5E3